MPANIHSRTAQPLRRPIRNTAGLQQPPRILPQNDAMKIGRKVRVDGVDGEYARCTVVADRDDARLTRARHNAQRPAGWSPVGHTTWILLRRFKPTSAGYRLIED